MMEQDNLFCCIDIFFHMPGQNRWRASEAQPWLRSRLSLWMTWKRRHWWCRVTRAALCEPPLCSTSWSLRVFISSTARTVICSTMKRLQLTLQTMIHHHITTTKSQHFYDTLLAVLKTYNATYHSAINIPPWWVDFGNAELVWDRFYGGGWGSRRLSVGDCSRMNKASDSFTRTTLDTGPWRYFRSWSFKNMLPITCSIADATGSFHGLELQVTQLDYFDFEAILDTCRLFHAPTRTTSSGCVVLHRTIHALWNLYGNLYKIVQKRKKKQSRDEGNPRQPHVYL